MVLMGAPSNDNDTIYSKFIFWASKKPKPPPTLLAIVRGVSNCIMHTQVFNFLQGPEL